MFLVLVLMLVLVLAVIFANAMMDSETSHDVSGLIVDMLLRIGVEDSESLEHSVRKMAHVFGYWVFGMCVMALTLFAQKKIRKPSIGFACFFVLLVAVLDEYIQSYSDRTSSTEDILFDFLGAMLGFLLIYAVNCIILRRKKNNTEEATE